MSDPVYTRFLLRRMSRRNLLAAAAVTSAAAVVTACSPKGASTAPGETASATSASGAASTSEPVSTANRPEGWTDATHGKDAAPDYATVFPLVRVNTMTLVIAPADWQAMLDDMTTLYGERGVEGEDQVQGGAPGGGNFQPGAAPGGVMPGGGMQRGGPGNFATANPMWVAGSVLFDGREWTKAGIRFKGNSTLMSAWRGGADKIPFKLDFDQWEDDYPEIQDQRFHGFKQLSLGTNIGDGTFLRETLAYDLFEEAGLPAANTAIYELRLDRGEGVTSLGLYTAIEVIDDTVVDRVFEDGSGNIYEADGPAASLAAGTDTQIEASFQAEGGGNPDWSDIQALYDAIHAESRTTDAAAWRAGMEEIFDVDGFLEWLAIAAAIQHWDTYGGMSHNYYLYNDPTAKRLSFISWDHNFVLGASGGGGQGRADAAGGVFQAPADGAQDEQPLRQFPGGGGARGGGPGMGSTSFDKADVSEEWPLIRFLLDQPEYFETYKGYLEAAVDLIDEGRAEDRYGEVVASISEHLPEADRQAFDEAVTALWATLATRRQAVRDFLAA
jgi:spore coat protein H